MESDQSLNDFLNKNEANKKEEISKYEHLINNFKSEQEPLNKIYINIFNNIIEKRLQLILEPEPDFMYVWKALQAARVLSRNKLIQNEMYKENHISIYQSSLTKLTNINPKGKIIESIIIELLTLIQRYIYSESDKDKELKEKYINLIINSDIIDNMILLLAIENDVLLKLLKSFFKNILTREKIIAKFTDPKTIKILLNILASKNNDSRPYSSLSTPSYSMYNKKTNQYLGIGTILDLFVNLIKEEKFINGFILLKGYNTIFNIIRANNEDEKHKENIIKSLYITQVVVKKIDNKKIYDIKSFTSLFEFLLENKTVEEDILVMRLLLNSFATFALSNELTVVIQSKWSELLFRLLLLLAIKIKDLKDTKEQKEIVANQTVITRILRQIYSFERNRNFFTQIIPQNIFKYFINIPINNRNQDLFNNFIKNINSLSNDEIEAILKKVNRIFASSTEDEYSKEEIGGYKILEMIGKGGFGSVYKVSSIVEKKEYAMKMVKLEQKQIKFCLEHPDEMIKAINEIRIWKLFDHPNIINYNNSFIWKDNCYIIMELVDGLSLGEYISYLKENNISMKQELIIKIILQIVSGLRHMHKSTHVIFRDLNPNNIMLDYSFNVKLIDFGLTVEENESKGKVSTLLNQSVQPVFEGSVLYSSPEVMENDIITYESDIWALGCIIYEMIKLRPPFSGDNPLTIAKNVCEGNYERLNENDFKSEEIIDLVNKCLIVNWKKRINIDNVCQILGPFLFDYISETKSKETQLQKEILDLI
jgi:hypothetical protein